MVGIRPRDSLLVAGSETLANRLSRIREPHVAPLNDLVEELSVQRGISEPWFDPDGGGVNARILLLLESPGPKSTAGKGSGIISPDNDDDTAENTWLLRREASIDPAMIVHWNAVPWFLDDEKKPTARVKEDGARFLKKTIQLMPALRVVVLAGRHAQDTWARYRKLPGAVAITTVETWHPAKLAIGLRRSPPVSGLYRLRQEELLAALMQARRLSEQPLRRGTN